MNSTIEPQVIAHVTDGVTTTSPDTRGEFNKMSKASRRMSNASRRWDQAEKGFLTDGERTAKNMDVEGKGHLSREQVVSLGSQYHSLKEDNKQIKKQLFGLAILCVVLFIGTIIGTVMAVKNSKDTIVDMKTGVMKVNDGNNNEVTVKAHGALFQTNGSIEEEEEYIDPDTNITSTLKVKSYCVSAEDVVSMWLANEQGTDARLVILEDFDDAGTDEDDDTDTEISSIKRVTSGDASWKKNHIVMGGVVFTPSEECTNADVHRRRLLLKGNVIDDMPSFDSISIHRALKQRVDFLSGRDLSDNGRMLASASRLGGCVFSCVKDNCGKSDTKCQDKFHPICIKRCTPDICTKQCTFYKASAS
jgi:hypothetical protein